VTATGTPKFHSKQLTFRPFFTRPWDDCRRLEFALQIHGFSLTVEVLGALVAIAFGSTLWYWWDVIVSALAALWRPAVDAAISLAAKLSRFLISCLRPDPTRSGAIGKKRWAIWIIAHSLLFGWFFQDATDKTSMIITVLFVAFFLSCLMASQVVHYEENQIWDGAKEQDARLIPPYSPIQKTAFNIFSLVMCLCWLCLLLWKLQAYYGRELFQSVPDASHPFYSYAALTVYNFPLIGPRVGALLGVTPLMFTSVGSQVFATGVWLVSAYLTLSFIYKTIIQRLRFGAILKALKEKPEADFGTDAADEIHYLQTRIQRAPFFARSRIINDAVYGDADLYKRRLIGALGHVNMDDKSGDIPFLEFCPLFICEIGSQPLPIQLYGLYRVEGMLGEVDYALTKISKSELSSAIDEALKAPGIHSKISATLSRIKKGVEAGSIPTKKPLVALARAVAPHVVPHSVATSKAQHPTISTDSLAKGRFIIGTGSPSNGFAATGRLTPTLKADASAMNINAIGTPPGVKPADLNCFITIGTRVDFHVNVRAVAGVAALPAGSYEFEYEISV
jgi:hypothetical protein